MKVLISGGAGFIGSHIADLFIHNGFDVCIIDSLIHGKEEYINSKSKFYKVDIRENYINDIFMNEKPDILIHEAAQIKVPKSIEDPKYDAEVNIIGSINILEAARKSGVKKIIYPSSAAIFGDPHYLPIDENHPIEMISGYGVSKHTAEHYLKVYKALYDIDYIVFRYSNVYGPRQDSSGEGGVVSIFAEKFSKNESPQIFGDGEQTRDFVYVKDVARANLQAVYTNKVGIYNVCTSEKTSINSLFRIFNEITGKNINPEYMDVRSGDIRDSYMSYSKIRQELGWAPKYSLSQGLIDMINQ